MEGYNVLPKENDRRDMTVDAVDVGLPMIEYLERERTAAQMRLARAVRNGLDTQEPGRDFAYAKAVLELTRLVQNYPPMTRSQRRAIKKLVDE
jgi:hypothetical protein